MVYAQFTSFANDWVLFIIELCMTVLEIMGLIVIMQCCISNFHLFLIGMYAKEKTVLCINMLRGLSLALGFYLAAEILKTVTVRSIEELYIVGIIVVLRIAIGMQIQWELKHDREALEYEQNQSDHEISNSRTA